MIELHINKDLWDGKRYLFFDSNNIDNPDAFAIEILPEQYNKIFTHVELIDEGDFLRIEKIIYETR